MRLLSETPYFHFCTLWSVLPFLCFHSECFLFIKFLLGDVLYDFFVIHWFTLSRNFSKICSHKRGPQNIKAKLQQKFGASVLSFIRKWPPRIVVSFQYNLMFLYRKLVFRNVKEIFAVENQRVLPSTYNSMIFKNSVVLFLV